MGHTSCGSELWMISLSLNSNVCTLERIVIDSLHKFRCLCYFVWIQAPLLLEVSCSLFHTGPPPCIVLVPGSKSFPPCIVLSKLAIFSSSRKLVFSFHRPFPFSGCAPISAFTVRGQSSEKQAGMDLALATVHLLGNRVKFVHYFD